MIGIEEESGFQRVDGTPVPDAALDSASTNSVQNKIVKAAIDKLSLKYIGVAEDSGAYSGDLSTYEELILILCPFKSASNKTFYTFNIPTLFFSVQSSVVIPQDISADGSFSVRITASASGISCASMGSSATAPKVWIYGR